MQKFLVLLSLVLLVIAQIPEQYDVRQVYPECDISVLNQGNCGSCWAHSTVEALSMRFCIASKGKVKPLLSPQYLANCDTTSNGCQGGDTLGAYTTISHRGNDDVSCTKYYSGTTGKTGSCPVSCDSGKAIIPQDLYFDNEGYSLFQGETKATMEAMQKDIIEHGPISASFVVRQDFLDFFRNNATKKDVYHTTYGRVLGGHAIVVLGWGVLNGVPYWECRNSWGPEWGDKGDFRIIRGSDDCNIESRRLSAGIPKLPERKSPQELLSSVAINRNAFEQAAVCDGCWTVLEQVDDDVVAMASVLTAQATKKQMEKVMQVRTQVVSGVLYKFDVQVQGENGMWTLVALDDHLQTANSLTLLSAYKH